MNHVNVATSDLASLDEKQLAAVRHYVEREEERRANAVAHDKLAAVLPDMRKLAAVCGREENLKGR